MKKTIRNGVITDKNNSSYQTISLRLQETSTWDTVKTPLRVLSYVAAGFLLKSAIFTIAKTVKPDFDRYSLFAELMGAWVISTCVLEGLKSIPKKETLPQKNERICHIRATKFAAHQRNIQENKEETPRPAACPRDPARQ